MDWITYAIIGMAIVVVGMFIFSNYYVSKNIQKLTPEDFRQNMRTAQIIDVRPTLNFKAGHIVGARNIPFALIKQRTNAIIKDKPVYLVCDNGKTSKRTALFLYSKGYTNLAVLKGGMASWDGKIK